MDTLLQQFELPVALDRITYTAWLYGRERQDGMWEGWLVFERVSDGARFTTGVETTQPNSRAILYWATGLSGAFFEGALRRALRPRKQSRAVPVPPPLIARGHDRTMRDLLRENIESAVLDIFSQRRAQQLLTREVFDTLPHSHADIVRALEHLEREERRIARRTEEGNDWLYLI
jgi:hypothetical protein